MAALDLALLTIALMFGVSGGASPCPGTYDVQAATHAYGADPDLQALDLYLPRRARLPPLAVYVHGGAWVSGDKGDYQRLGAAFAHCGIAAAVINYRLAPAVDVAAQLDDVAGALHWLAASSESAMCTRSARPTACSIVLATFAPSFSSAFAFSIDRFQTVTSSF